MDAINLWTVAITLAVLLLFLANCFWAQWCIFFAMETNRFWGSKEMKHEIYPRSSQFIAWIFFDGSFISVIDWGNSVKPSFMLLILSPTSTHSIIWAILLFERASLMPQMVKSLPAMQKTQVQSLGWEDLLEKEMATHSSILAWKIPRMEEPGRLESMGSQRVWHD